LIHHAHSSLDIVKEPYVAEPLCHSLVRDYVKQAIAIRRRQHMIEDIDYTHDVTPFIFFSQS
jgi:hypothetical protein